MLTGSSTIWSVGTCVARFSIVHGSFSPTIRISALRYHALDVPAHERRDVRTCGSMKRRFGATGERRVAVSRYQRGGRLCTRHGRSRRLARRPAARLYERKPQPFAGEVRKRNKLAERRLSPQSLAAEFFAGRRRGIAVRVTTDCRKILRAPASASPSIFQLICIIINKLIARMYATIRASGVWNYRHDSCFHWPG